MIRPAISYVDHFTHLTKCPCNDGLNNSTSIFIKQMDLIDDEKLYFLPLGKLSIGTH